MFIDEAGNFDFSSTGTKYFILTAVLTEDPVQGAEALLRLRHTVLEEDPASFRIRKVPEFDCFHCTEDPEPVRERVFNIIESLDLTVFSVLIQKNKANPAIRDDHVFYERAFGALVPYVVRYYAGKRTVNVFLAEIRLSRKKKALVGALKATLNRRVPGTHRLFMHPGHSHHMFQVVDYCCWAIQRHWERLDGRRRAQLSSKIIAEADIFRRGETTYYELA